MAGQIILGITYDIIPESDKDKYFSASEKALAGLNIAAVPGVFLVDALPFRQFFLILCFNRITDFMFSEAYTNLVSWCRVPT